MEYKSPTPLSRDEAERIFGLGTPFEVSEALISSVLHGDDREWAEAWVIRLMGHSDTGVRETAAVALGHLARLHGGVSARALEAVNRLLDDERTAGSAADGLDDTEMFCRSLDSDGDESRDPG